MREKRVVSFTILVLGLAAQAYAATTDITFKQPPATEDERAVAQIMETLAAKTRSDARGASQLYTQDAVVRSFFGSENTEKLTVGREAIYFLFSAAMIRSVEYRDVTIRVAGDRADVAGHVSIVTSRSEGSLGLVDYLRQEQRTWQLRREPEGWRIYSSDAQGSTDVRR